MAEKRLPVGVLVDEEDLVRVNKHFWQLLKSRNTFKVYTTIDSKIVYLHRFLMSPPDTLVVDHKNGSGLDNRKENLRNCTNQQNLLNQGPRKGLKYKGVTKLPSGAFRARLCVHGFRFQIGIYPTEDEAAIAYNIAALLFHGEFAKLNEV